MRKEGPVAGPRTCAFGIGAAAASAGAHGLGGAAVSPWAVLLIGVLAALGHRCVARRRPALAVTLLLQLAFQALAHGLMLVGHHHHGEGMLRNHLVAAAALALVAHAVEVRLWALAVWAAVVGWVRLLLAAWALTPPIRYRARTAPYLAPHPVWRSPRLPTTRGPPLPLLTH